jgi:hypothetical protein
MQRYFRGVEQPIQKNLWGAKTFAWNSQLTVSECLGYASISYPTRFDVSYYTLFKMPKLNNIQLMQQEGRIALAIDALKQGHFTSFKGAAKSYDIQ